MIRMAGTAKPDDDGIAAASGTLRAVLHIDVSLTLRHHGHAPVGMVRIEQALIRHFRHDPRLEVRFVCVDRATDVWRGLTPPEMDAVTGTAAPPPAPDRPIWVDGGVLLCSGNPWDLVEGEQLASVRRMHRISPVFVLNDVLPMQLPHLTAGQAIAPYIANFLSVVRQATHLVGISAHTVNVFRDLVGQPEGITAQLTRARLPDVLRETARHLRPRRPALLPPGRSFVLFCSTIEIRKNHNAMLHVWERLRQELPPEQLPVLVFAGAWGWGVEPVRLWVERNWRLAPHLCVLGTVEDAELVWLYRHAAFSVFPSLGEGYGLPAAESLAMGTPVIVSDCPALLEATEGLMPAIDPLDIPAWHRKIRRLILDRPYLATLRARAADYRGPAPDAFANAVRSAVLSAAEQNAASPAVPMVPREAR
jgi:glycosyltransferase involved in cell wall biosynthesis